MTENPFESLRKYLGDDYCARCDSFLAEPRPEMGLARPFCAVCWKWAKPLPSSLRLAIERGLGLRAP